MTRSLRKVGSVISRNESSRNNILELRPGRILNIYKYPPTRRTYNIPKPEKLATDERNNIHIFSVENCVHNCIKKNVREASTSTDNIEHELNLKKNMDDMTSELKFTNTSTNKINNVLHTFKRENIKCREKCNGKTINSPLDCHNSVRDGTKTLFFIHGVGGSSNSWSSQLRYFESHNYVVIAMDLIGHGLSCAPDRQREYTFTEICEDMHETFAKFHGYENILIGHSYGCSFAAYLAHEYTHLVTRLVLISGGAPTPLSPQPSVFSLPVCCLAGVRPCINFGFNKKAIHYSHRARRLCDQTLDVPSYVLRHTMNGQVWDNGNTSYHGNIRVATLLIHGSHDRIITLEQDRFMHQTIPESQLVVVDNASHMVMMEQPDKVNKLIHDFIEQSAPVAVT